MRSIGTIALTLGLGGLMTLTAPRTAEACGGFHMDELGHAAARARLGRADASGSRLTPRQPPSRSRTTPAPRVGGTCGAAGQETRISAPAPAIAPIGTRHEHGAQGPRC